MKSSSLYTNPFNPLEKLGESEVTKNLFVIKREKRKRHLRVDSNEVQMTHQNDMVESHENIIAGKIIKKYRMNRRSDEEARMISMVHFNIRKFQEEYPEREIALILCIGCKRSSATQPDSECIVTTDLTSMSYLPVRFTNGSKKYNSPRLLNSLESLLEYI